MIMSTEIPMQLKFNQLYSHTFPGFFFAVTFFMLMDVWSPLNLTALALDSVTNLVAFIGFIFVMGTILGVINDGIHHSIIEDKLFDRSEEVKKMFTSMKELTKDYRKNILKKVVSCSAGEKCGSKHDHLGRTQLFDEYILDQYYLFGNKSDRIIAIDIYLNEEFYCYSEFYCNAFLSLVPFSIVAPYYLSSSVEMSWNLALLLGVIAILLSIVCLYSGYYIYLYYCKALYSLVSGYVDSLSNSSDLKENYSSNTKGKAA
jgi:hypothetical protein